MSIRSFFDFGFKKIKLFSKKLKYRRILVALIEQIFLILGQITNENAYNWASESHILFHSHGKRPQSRVV